MTEKITITIENATPETLARLAGYGVNALLDNTELAGDWADLEGSAEREEQEAPDTGNAAPSPTPPAGASESEGSAAAGSAVETDADGLPWDQRIHSSSKSCTKDGKWKKKRGVPPETVAQVEAELRQTMAAPAPAAAPADSDATAQPVPGVNTAPPPPPPGPGPSVEGNDAPPPPPPGPPAEQPAEQPAANAFSELLQRVTALQTEGKLSTAQIIGLCEGLGVPNMLSLNQRPDLIPQFMQQLEAATCTA